MEVLERSEIPRLAFDTGIGDTHPDRTKVGYLRSLPFFTRPNGKKVWRLPIDGIMPTAHIT